MKSFLRWRSLFKYTLFLFLPMLLTLSACNKQRAQMSYKKLIKEKQRLELFHCSEHYPGKMETLDEMLKDARSKMNKGQYDVALDNLADIHRYSWDLFNETKAAEEPVEETKRGLGVDVSHLLGNPGKEIRKGKRTTVLHGIIHYIGQVTGCDHSRKRFIEPQASGTKTP